VSLLPHGEAGMGSFLIIGAILSIGPATGAASDPEASPAVAGRLEERFPPELLARMRRKQQARHPEVPLERLLPCLHGPVTGPVGDGVSLGVPPELGNQRLAALGLVDVTAAPFDADPTGHTDATEALQSAIDFARDRQMVCRHLSALRRCGGQHRR
jgi:hypothetical protein